MNEPATNECHESTCDDRQSEALPNSKLLENIGINTTFQKKDGVRNYLKPLS